ncbi:hypothetical protein HQ325_16730 [Rhodococcus sp. BP-349]|uniref:hypothetical protein n=1 Tax=unclassified Rhodococcus (in: high G+C Gram-positive bacteria) TaxID=192944 RepID=UPI001C9B64C8|nr:MULTISPECIES: hypothetical protein [unclassified Rhodococcus (in: high G+C Gram-positive bacteria)]MBY6540321.1 hypothetical protein [Rhodococcus sp. BP-363]MBY6545654.1 hypothetical protein [Rhodococcus sp. BP-369]MBY6564884.1 hypothetical protein [Rhodococcus sp. BP-370]MBY6578180.1 hypothetical protein [Rhodococcus sp. BP-364]MBY6587481.1 hypothetical protein [Rhodococcus sp. BP-358]
MIPYGVVLALLIIASVTSFRVRDAVVSNCVAAAWIASAIAFLALWVTNYIWANQTGCQVKYREHFGYTASNLEIAQFTVSTERSWWPVGWTCSGISNYTGRFEVIAEQGWGLSIIVYAAAVIVMSALTIIVGRVITLSGRSRIRRAR